MENLSSSYLNNQIKSPSFNKLNKNKILKKRINSSQNKYLF